MPLCDNKIRGAVFTHTEHYQLQIMHKDIWNSLKCQTYLCSKDQEFISCSASHFCRCSSKGQNSVSSSSPISLSQYWTPWKERAERM